MGQKCNLQGQMSQLMSYVNEDLLSAKLALFVVGNLGVMVERA